MIQRIQSLYLLISVVLAALLFFLPFAEIAKDGAIYLFNAKGILLEGVATVNGLILSIVIGLSVVLHMLSILSFKNRMRQKRIVLLAMIVMLGLFGLLFYYAYFTFTGAKINLEASFLLPLIAIIIDYLAIRAIDKDEALIRSIDRIR